MSDRSRLRVRFLNVGQGNSTHISLPDGQHMLVDINRDRKNGGIDVVRYLEDELPDGDHKQRLDYFVNTHPHDDHIRGTGDLHDTFEINELWHSGHERDLAEGENDEYDRFRKTIDDLGESARAVSAGSDPWAEIDAVTFHVFRPSSYVKPEQDMTEEERREAIHNECMVLRISYAGRAVMLTGDSNLAAWESILSNYDRDGLLGADVLSASHHGSRTFFKKEKDDEAYRDHLDTIAPDVVVISVGSENPHDHPHDDAIEEYEAEDRSVYRTDEDLTVDLTIYENGEIVWGMGDQGFQDSYQLPGPNDDDDPDDGGDAGSRSGGYTPRKEVTEIGGGRYA